MKVFIFNGKGCAGKTSTEKMIQDIAAAHNKKIDICSTIDYVKSIAEGFGWNGSKSLADREMLSNLKDLLTKWNDIPYKKVCEKIKVSNDEGAAAIFIDCREPQEIQRFVDDFGALTVLVRRNSLDLVYGNHADDNVEDFEYDIYIDNNKGLDELFQEAAIFYETFIEEVEL